MAAGSPSDRRLREGGEGPKPVTCLSGAGQSEGERRVKRWGWVGPLGRGCGCARCTWGCAGPRGAGPGGRGSCGAIGSGLRPPPAVRERRGQPAAGSERGKGKGRPCESLRWCEARRRRGGPAPGAVPAFASSSRGESGVVGAPHVTVPRAGGSDKACVHLASAAPALMTPSGAVCSAGEPGPTLRPGVGFLQEKAKLS